MAVIDTQYARTVLGHTRLSIIDLSVAGNQPMSDPSGRYTIVFNGEIYNYRELRDELALLDVHCQSSSDTEVLIAAWSHWGSDCVARLEGMFAFVIHDREKALVTCVRDAFGIKPLFYTVENGGFYFASEARAVSELKPCRARADLQQAHDYLVYGIYDNSTRTFIEGVSQLAPGHILEVELKTLPQTRIVQWWHPSVERKSELSFADAADAVRELFLTSVRHQLRSDVPLGTALSGGVDSSALVCAMRYVEPDMPIHTFSYLADDPALSEERWVSLVNAHVGAQAHVVSASGGDLIRDLDEMIRSQGEPFGSTSIYAQFRVFRLAREAGITVTLDGQGADELLAGYEGFPGYRLLSLISAFRYSEAARFLRNWCRWPARDYRLIVLELARALASDRTYSLLRAAGGRVRAPDWLVDEAFPTEIIETREKRARLTSEGRGRRVIEHLAQSLQGQGLPGLLRHGDRNSMHFSVESRVPFLTTELCGLLFSLPEGYLISESGETKSVFRAAMRGIVPDAILDRRDKIGFGTPERDWILGCAEVFRSWLAQGEGVYFMDRNRVLEGFDAVVAGRIPFTSQVWRWINYVRWYEMMICDNL